MIDHNEILWRVPMPVNLAPVTQADPFFGNGVALAVYQWCILRAMRENCATPLPRQRKALKRGQVAIGQKQLAEALGFGRQQIRTALDFLVGHGFFNQQTNHQGTIITVNGYDTLTDMNRRCQPANQPTGNQRVTNDQPHTETVETGENEKRIPAARASIGVKMLKALPGPDPERQKATERRIRELRIAMTASGVLNGETQPQEPQL